MNSDNSGFNAFGVSDLLERGNVAKGDLSDVCIFKFAIMAEMSNLI
jgi:hypothetical protein